MQLIVFERADWDRKEVTVDYMGALAWSPDGRTLVRLGRDELILYDERLHVRKTVKQAHREQRPIGGLAVWAPDSSKFVAAFQGQLVVASRNGKVTKVDLPHERFATGGGFVGGFGRSFIYWEGSDKFVAISRPDGADVAVGEYERYSFRLQGGRWEAVAIQAGPGFPESSLPGETEPGGGFYQGRTADGSADVFTTMRFNAEQRVTHVWVAGEPEVHFQVIDDGDPIGGLGTWFDIVIVRE